MGIFNKKTAEMPGRRRRSSDDVRTPAEQNDRQHVFARNRTLTGSTSNYVNDIGRQADLQSPRGHAHHLALRRRKIGSVFLIVLGAVVALLIFLLQFTAVVHIAVSDTSVSKKMNEQVYVNAVNDYLATNPLARLRVAFDKDSLKNYLVGVVPEVANVDDISLGGIGETTITLSMRHPVAGWTINATQYFVDDTGIAFRENYFTNPSVQIVDNSGVSLEQGTAVASNRFLSFVGRVVALSKSRGYTVTEAIIPVNTTRQLEIVVQEVATHIKLSVDRAVGEQTEDMTRALDYLKARGIQPSYVDVRVSGKAFYK